MIRELTIRNYRSILDHTIELGRINVFIGENGCGKTNVLEALAMAAAAVTNKLSVEELFNRGMRVAKPSIMRSSFRGAAAKEIAFQVGLEGTRSRAPRSVEIRLSAADKGDGTWVDSLGSAKIQLGKGSDARKKADALNTFLRELPHADEAAANEMAEALKTTLGTSDGEAVAKGFRAMYARLELADLLGSFGVYDADLMALRGFTITSRRSPLGLYGETLDVAIHQLPPAAKKDLLERARCISWLDRFVVEPSDPKKYEGHKLGKSQSTLYFHDRHMRRGNDVFSAENVNEGILRILFHLTLFISASTPAVLGIDNIETALNPQLCRDLMAQLPALAERHGKQALITTHNPAVLDGLDLNDPEQRLFVVSRDDGGHTRTRRIKVKPEIKDAKYKLSELWMRGHLGGLPERF